MRGHLFDHSSYDTRESRTNWVRLRTLIVLRWIAVGGQLAAITIAINLFNLDLNLGLCFLAIGASILANIFAMFVFPEGTRQPAGPAIGEMYDGVAYLAAKTGARALPIGISGTGEAMGPGTKFPKREKVVIEVGELIDPPQASGKRVTVGDRAAYSDRLAATLEQLMQSAYEARG